MMQGAPSIIAGAPSILSEWAKMPFTQVDLYESYGRMFKLYLRIKFIHTNHTDQPEDNFRINKKYWVHKQ